PDLCRRFLCSVLRSARKSERKSYGHVDSFGNGKAVAHGAALERCRTHVYGFGCREITGLSSCGAHTRTSGGRPVVVTSAHRTLCRGFRGSDRKPGRATGTSWPESDLFEWLASRRRREQCRANVS